MAASDGVLPSPGVPERHPVFAIAAAAGVPVRSEFDLAATWDRRPFLAITGTDGKTTVTTMVTAMLRASGVRAVAAGNIDVPLVAAIDDPEPEVFVVEASSFRLSHATVFRPTVATWLNVAADHQDVHLSVSGYHAAKARVWANLTADDLAVANADDPVVLAHAGGVPRLQTFGLGGPGTADWYVDGSMLRGPDALEIVDVGELHRSLPHDVANALAAAATAMNGGAVIDGVRTALREFRGLPHRVELVGEAGGVRYFDDSKATAPHATLAAVAGFRSVVLIAGGRNKGLDLVTARHRRIARPSGRRHRRGRPRGAGGVRWSSTGRRRGLDARGRRRRPPAGRARRCGAAVAGLRVVRLVPLLRRTGRRLPTGRARGHRRWVI